MSSKIECVTLVIVGCGNRGNIYSTYCEEFPERARVVAVAEPNAARRAQTAKRFALAESGEGKVFADWREVMEAPRRVADAALICLQDQDHREAAVAFAGRGYHILLEKPMAVTREDCEEIAVAVEAAGVMFAIGHVLRYTPYSRLLHRLIHQDRLIGRVVNMQHLEPIGFAHAAHSYVRGSWGNTARSSPLLLAKSCHDVDWILWMMKGHACTAVSSFGSRMLFRKESKPPEAGDSLRCLDCHYEPSCPYSAPKLYLRGDAAGMERNHWVGKIVDPKEGRAINDDDIIEALRDGPYGRCV